MSGFGGFGSSSSSDQRSTGFGGGNGNGNGNGPAAFGSSQNVVPSTGFSGFGGASQSQSGASFVGGITFGSAPGSMAPPTSGFGGGGGDGGFAATSTSAFGSGSMNSNNNQVPIATAPSGFGGAANNSNFGGTVNGGFGRNSASGGVSSFGSSSSAPSGFGTNSNNTTASSGFGAAPSTSMSTSGVAFGTSSNVMMANTKTAQPGPTTSQQNSFTSFGQSQGWNTSKSNDHGSGTSFGTSASSGFGNSFQSKNISENSMMDDDRVQHNNMIPSEQKQSFGFGQSNSGSSTMSQNRSMTLVPEHPHHDNHGDKKKKNEEARLKAKIEEKKKLLQAKLEERKKRQKEKERKIESSGNVDRAHDDGISHNSSLAGLSANAPPFVPKTKTSEDNASLAQRNALRFGDQSQRTKTRDMLPADMRTKADHGASHPPPPSVDSQPIISSQQKSTARENLQTAEALVGSCEYFCPDEELLRRERESDIQQLEIPLPGNLHPEDWTLRNTVVKRFRRSAADYKLDVPEWVRPPDVLERVCGYLEEWVMERDRQGPDPRFPQGQTPPPLEVYQFIWDRTRMIRKDFTLQNYVGTGGKCDARAVRCHERIARWHAMCEHQLSHIDDFVTMQSQQNIQELGQTMKTLNQFYDDNLRRTTVEVPDRQGQETRRDLSGFSHGCTVGTIQGKSPIEFDGTNLENSADGPGHAKRILGKHAVNTPGRGTAEPEMRGLYMLLIMNNEGGMELLKYAAKLFQERPQIYHSKPVQLALEIFKTKKEYNYARFFTILRAPTTPYLFCCIMFKHVELMRKVAIRIMTRAFGARKKDTGESMYDSYPLARLVDLLCFEDLDEAREACIHYNITVKKVKSSKSDDVSDVIFWKASEFREPKHPEKGYVLPLQPKKMVRTIERKLLGATRLAVCRGEVSGDGATLASIPIQNTGQPNLSTIPAPMLLKKVEEKGNDAARLKEQVEKARVEKIRISNEQKEARIREEKRKEEEEEMLKREFMEREKLENQRRLELLERQKRENEEKRRIEEKERLASEQRARDEVKRLLKEQEEKRKIAAAQREKELAEERRRKAEAQAEKERQKRIFEKKRAFEEEKRQAELRRKLLERQKREAEEFRQKKEWENKVGAARKIVVWKRWKKSCARKIERSDLSAKSLRRLDPTFGKSTVHIQTLIQEARNAHALESMADESRERTLDMRTILERCIRGRAIKVSLSEFVADEISASEPSYIPQCTLLLKVGLFIPDANMLDDLKTNELVCKWVDTRLRVGTVDTSELRNGNKGNPGAIQIRSVIHLCKSAKDSLDCDVALILIPPWCSTTKERGHVFTAAKELIDNSMPRVVLALNDFDNRNCHESDVLTEALGTSDSMISIVSNQDMTCDALEHALVSSCQKVATSFVRQSCVEIMQMITPVFAAKAISAYVWSQLPVDAVSDESSVLVCAQSAVSRTLDASHLFFNENEEIWSSWPPRDFVSENGVEGYFLDGTSLPSEWKMSLHRGNLDKDLTRIQNCLVGSFRNVVEKLLFDAQQSLRDECSVLISRKCYRRALQVAIEGFAECVDQNDWQHVYFPHGTMKALLDRLSTRNPRPKTASLVAAPRPDTSLLDIIGKSNENILMQTASLLPHEVEPPVALAPTTSKRRRRQGTTTLDGSKRYRSSRGSTVKQDLEESAALTTKLENLLEGGSAEDLSIGDSCLSEILRGVPKIAQN